MRILSLGAIAVAIAYIEASVLPWLPFMQGLSLVAVFATVMVMRDTSGYAYLWTALVVALLVDVLLGAPLAVRSVLLLAAFVLVQPFVRTFRLQHGLRSLLAIGITLTVADRLGIMLGHRPETWTARGGAEVLVWASAIAWTVVIILLMSRGLRRRTILHAVTPI